MSGAVGGAFDMHRERCARHLRRRAGELGLGADDIERVEAMLERMRAVFERPGETRYRLTIQRPGARIGVVYDTYLHCLVTAWER